RIAHERELEIVGIELWRVTNEAGVLDVERHVVPLEVVKNRSRSRLGDSIPQKSFFVGDRQIVCAGCRQDGDVRNRLEDELRDSGGAVQTVRLSRPGSHLHHSPKTRPSSSPAQSLTFSRGNRKRWDWRPSGPGWIEHALEYPAS